MYDRNIVQSEYFYESIFTTIQYIVPEGVNYEQHWSTLHAYLLKTLKNIF
jgi:hypothetical protein